MILVRQPARLARAPWPTGVAVPWPSSGEAGRQPGFLQSRQHS